MKFHMKLTGGVCRVWIFKANEPNMYMNQDVNFSVGYVCGVVCSDGKMVWDEKHGNYYISLETKSKELAELFLENIKPLIEKEPSIRTNERRTGGVTIFMNIVSVYGRKTIEHLVSRYGISSGRKKWSVPRAAWDNSDFRIGFLRGFFDGSGSVSVYIETKGSRKIKKRSIRLYSVNQEGLLQFRKLLDSEGIKSIMYASGDIHTIKISGKTRLQLFRDRIGFGLTDKKEALEEALLPFTLSGYEDKV